MKATRSKNFFYIVPVLILSMSAVAATAHESSRKRSKQNAEVMTGDFTCGVDFTEGSLFSFYSFQATGDIFLRSPYHGAAQVEGPSQENCDIFYTPASQIAASGGCTVGPEVRYEDEGGVSRSFQFVCHGERSELTSILAEFISAQLTARP